jgi:hypothetical protein
MGDGSLQSHSGANLNPNMEKDRGNVPKGGEAGRVALTPSFLSLLSFLYSDRAVHICALGAVWGWSLGHPSIFGSDASAALVIQGSGMQGRVA